MANYSSIRVQTSEHSKQNNLLFSVGTCDFGRLQPIATFEVVPNDKVKLNLKNFCRAAPPSAPVYGRIKVHTDAFFVPYRLLWTEWDNYIAGLTDSTPPCVTVQSLQNDAKQVDGNGGDYVFADEQEFQVSQDVERILGGLKYSSRILHNRDLPTSVQQKKITSFPIRAYKRIWWDYYRDSVNISDTTKSTYITTVGGSSASDGVDKLSLNPEVMYRCYGKDYITTALPSANGQLQPNASANSIKYGALAPGISGSTVGYATYNPQNSAPFGSVSVPVQALRAANALQRYMEKNNIVGTRLISRLLARFGATPSAERMQRAEYLGSYTYTMKVNDIDAQESTDMYGESAETIYNAFGSSESFANIRGQATGKITGGKDGMSFNYHSSEFGIIIILRSIMPDESYYQGLDRSLIRGLSTPNADRFDFFTPEFANLGYQPVVASDVYFPDSKDKASFNTSYDPNKVFGYQPRYHDYKFMRHNLYGDFVSRIFNTGMDSYHLFRDLSFLGQSADQQEMAINYAFNQLDIQERLKYSRIFQIPATKHNVVGNDGTMEVTATLDHFQVYDSIEYEGMRPMPGDDMPELVAGENENGGKSISVPNGGIRM